MDMTTTHPIERFYELYSHKLYHRIVHIVHDHDAASDLLQDTFLRALRALPQLKADSNVYGWLYTIATNVSRDYLRHNQLIHWQPLEPLHDAYSVEDSQSHVAERDALSRALQSLPEHYRTALLMDAQGMRQRELASKLGWTEGKAHMVIARARKALRDEYRRKEVA